MEFIQYTNPIAAGGLQAFQARFERQVFPWHFHHEYTLILVEEGSAEYIFTDKTIKVNPGELLIINPCVTHYNTSYAPRGWTYKGFFLPLQPGPEDAAHGRLAGPAYSGPPDPANGRLAPREYPQFACRAILNPPLFLALLDIHEQVIELREEDPFLPNLILKLLCDQVDHEWKNQGPDEGFSPLLAYIDGHLSDKLPITQLCDQVNLSPFYFQRTFKKKLGLTVRSYIQMKRLELAKQLLHEGHSIVSVALETGHFDQSHFHHAFRKMYGLTPGQLSRS